MKTSIKKPKPRPSTLTSGLLSALPEENPKVLKLRTPFVVKKQKDKNCASEQTCCLGSGFFLQVLEVLFDGVEGLFPGQAPAASFGVVF